MVQIDRLAEKAETGPGPKDKIETFAPETLDVRHATLLFSIENSREICDNFQQECWALRTGIASGLCLFYSGDGSPHSLGVSARIIYALIITYILGGTEMRVAQPPPRKTDPGTERTRCSATCQAVNFIVRFLMEILAFDDPFPLQFNLSFALTTWTAFYRLPGSDWGGTLSVGGALLLDFALTS